MNNFFLRWTTSFALLLALGTETKAAEPNNSPGTATVVRLHGKARYSTDGKSWLPVKKNILLQEGAVLQTAEDSSMDIRIGPEHGSSPAEPAEGIVRLEPATVLVIERLSVDRAQGAPDIQLDLRNGRIAGRVGQMPAGSHYEVKFAKGIAGVRTGIFRISASGDVAVPMGETVVVTVNSDRNPVSTVVTTGKQFNSMNGSVTELRSGSAMEKTAVSPPPATAAPSNSNSKGPGIGGSLRNF